MQTVSPARPQRAMVIDEINMVRIWLEDKVAQRELTPQEADQKLREYEGDGKLVVGPLRIQLAARS